MKIRSDYVTNSSSSSFVIAYKAMPEIDEETLNKYPFLKNYGELLEKILFTSGYNETSRGEIYKNKEEWDNHLLDWYGWGDDTIEDVLRDEYSIETYKEAIDCLENGFYILQKSIDYCDDFLISMFHELAKDKQHFIILEEYE